MTLSFPTLVWVEHTQYSGSVAWGSLDFTDWMATSYTYYLALAKFNLAVRLHFQQKLNRSNGCNEYDYQKQTNEH
jgi:hypothetical protein